jgi:hypothetical protein
MGIGLHRNTLQGLADGKLDDSIFLLQPKSGS